MKLEKDTWYWVSHPHEGDIFYPVHSVDGVYVLMDEKHYKSEDLDGLIINKAVMPVPHQSNTPQRLLGSD